MVRFLIGRGLHDEAATATATSVPGRHGANRGAFVADTVHRGFFFESRLVAVFSGESPRGSSSATSGFGTSPVAFPFFLLPLAGLSDASVTADS